MRPPAVLAIHGGAGPAPDDADDADDHGSRWARQAAGLAAALRAGLAVLSGGGAALEAVLAAVTVLEDDEEWNAGRGSALTAAGTVEMDAAVADGRGRRLGGVAAVTGVRHPVLAARAVMDDGRHVLLAGPGAEAFAREAGLAFEPQKWFITDRRRRALARRPVADRTPPVGGSTVGAVARDAGGHLAAATSTGGRTGQIPGRVGDSPVPGAGTWAEDATCAVSATGVGEAFLRAAFAHEVDARLRLEGADLDAACRAALAAVTAAGGDGGCIAVSGEGRPVMPFTTGLMHRGWVEVGGPMWVAAAPGPLQRID
ncbi:MAG: L-asparaginase / beta-aspartyl-peptidase [Actinomycetota bacterium]|jgi:isoaspartyl peptidase/L-asparaginase-like protein (Ntn-hydrolase superfamily)|nr:L-asparaginase / beta-aspartyl-peptidase [Actinomycetota bacterium]